MINHKNLKAWQVAHELTIEVFKFLETNDLKKNYRLKDQLQGSILSVGSNISEGAKGTQTELKRYIRIAISSCSEFEYQLLVLKDMNYISIEVYSRWQSKVDLIIGSLINYSKTIL